MADHLARGGAGIGKAEMKHNIVQPGFQNLQHLFAGDSAAAQRFFIHPAELPFNQAVVILELLLLNQAFAIFGGFAAGLRAMHAGTIIAAFEIFRGAENRDAETAADANAGTCVTSHINL